MALAKLAKGSLNTMTCTAAKAAAFGGTVSACDRHDGAQAADHELIVDLYDREQLSLRRYLVYLGVDAETASETVQESFLRLHQHLLTGGDRKHLRAWLYRVAHNLARNSQMSARSSKTAALDDMTGREAADGRISAEEQLLAREGEQRLRSALESLSPAQQSCLVLRSQGLRYREIAEALGLSTSTVAENIQRGLEKLKRCV